jgi:NAD(P)-dependent dehydrogenase (short-subunit alcohol dehydrogenase family)
MPQTILIVGATRGLGLEFARQYTAEGARVLATHRRPEDAERLRALGAEPLLLDVNDAAQVAGLARQLDGVALDLAVVNAGVLGSRSAGLAPPPADEFDAVMHTNVLAPMRLLALLAEPLATAHGRVAVISSRMGSVALAGTSSSWLYRASKAALNMVLKVASGELGARGVICLALHPGWVRTDMGGANADIDVVTSVTGMRQVIAGASPQDNGAFFDYAGEALPW